MAFITVRNKKWLFSFALILLLQLAPLEAQRETVLKQIDLPHNYYYREMYLPQVTSGPGSVDWSPDSASVVYSMQGSLWRQKLDSTVPEQLTAGPGYDYQPDWSPDGKWIAFSRYDKDAVEIHLLDLANPQRVTMKQITTGGAVNVEPRWSPDGKKLAFVSTAYNKRFHIFVAHIENGMLQKTEQITEERRSQIPRYYYSPFDHEISPTWSPNSSEIIFVSNRENTYGTGGFWRKKADLRAEPRQIHYEETAWRARPDWSPDGKRVIYSSYLGRQWHQLWIMTSEGGDVFPLTYGEFDITNARWSPDGSKIAFISNRDGNTSLWIHEMNGGNQQKLMITGHHYLKPMGRIKLKVLDPSGKTSSARVSITGEDGRAYVPDNAWFHADDGFVRSERPFESHYFHTSGEDEISVPPGEVTVEVLKGFEHRFEMQKIQMQAGENRLVEVHLKPLEIPDWWGNWISGDLHIHMNYGGTYRNTPEHLRFQAEAENLRVAINLIVNKEQRIPDIAYFTTKPDPASTAKTLILQNQEFHTSYWGHLGLLNLKKNYLIPDYSAYSNSAAASPYPTNAVIADLTHAQGGLVGYVHPWDWDPDPAKEPKLTNELPVDVALGKVDYYEVLGFSDPHATAHVWYRLLNCGFRVPAGGGTDAMANFASLRGPVGTNRVYVNVPEPLKADSWMEALRQGKTFATNGPLLGFVVNEKTPGSELNFDAGKNQLDIKASVRSMVPLDHLQVVMNGEVVREIDLSADRMSADFSGTLPVENSGWMVLRAWAKNPTYPVLDLYPYASTSPIYITVNNAPVRSPEDAAYFIQWIERIIEDASKHPEYNTEAEKEMTLKTLKDAKAIFEQRRNVATTQTQ
jgi:TolB protein